MDLRQLRYFVLMANAGSISAASARAHVTQSALSRQLNLLEQELGVMLFERQHRGVRLTEPGEVLLGRATALLNESDDLRSAVGAAAREPTGVLRIGSAPSLRSMIVAPALSKFQRTYPKVRLTLREGSFRSMTDALEAGELDMAVVSNRRTLTPFRVVPLVSESLCWVGPPKAGLRVTRPVDVKTLLSKPLVLPGPVNSVREIVDRELERRGLAVQPVIEADAATLMLDVVRQGVGYTVLSFGAVRDSVLAGQVSACPVRRLRIEWVIVLPRDRPQTVASLRAVQFLRALCAARIRDEEWPTAVAASARSGEGDALSA